MAGLRERKKEQTRRRIAEVALRLFDERGFDAVTVTEIAEAADVAKATLFAYFPTKESLVLQGVAEEDLAAIVTGRTPGRSPLEALRAHFRVLAGTEPPPAAERDALTARIRVIYASPALMSAASARHDLRRRDLARVLTGEYGRPLGALVAAQVSASLLALQEAFFDRLLNGSPASGDPDEHLLTTAVDLAFDLLEHGLDHVKGR